MDTLDDVVVSAKLERIPERERPSSRALALDRPDVVTVMRHGEVRARLVARFKPQDAPHEIQFRRSTTARRLSAESVTEPVELQRDRLTADGKLKSLDVTLELASEAEEAAELPVVIPFGERISLVNVDYLRLRNGDHQILYDVKNVIHPETRRCVNTLGIADDGKQSANRFFLMADGLGDCQRAVRTLKADLLFADGVPEQLRHDLSALYEPIFNIFARKLGSEPGLVFVAWQPGSSQSTFRLEHSWSRNSLLMFSGIAWQRGIDASQQQALSDSFSREQLLRRLQWQGRPEAFAQSAMDYLLLTARSEIEGTTRQSLAAKLPTWIAACARQLNQRARDASPLTSGLSYECGLVLHFVYDAAARSRGGAGSTIFRTWRRLLSESFERGEAGVRLEEFVSSSRDARRVMYGLLDGSMTWPQFVAELGRLGVQLRIAADQPEVAVEVVSLTHFRDYY